MIERVLAGESTRQVARSTRCSPSTATTARDRWQRASEVERAMGRGVRRAVRSRGRVRGRSGALLHIDAYKAPKFDAPGHRVFDKSYVGRTRGLGHTVVIAVQDDHTRLV
jgi:hypothetical protein